ncbi:MAG: UDP-N-acetylmuramate--L-alanine ligase [Fusobacterium sp.]|nr:UDP-N-acetylmuramate--L-alanine ligase [Fusobacterium sp.]
MSALAKIMKCKGYDVIGADISESYVTEELISLGIKVYTEHNAKNLKGVDFVVASTAIKESNPEIAYAKENNLKILKRGELLAKLLNEEVGISIAGTHGKTTTSSMLGATMLSKDPTIVIGGILPEIKSNAKYGSNKYFIAEADESDNSFLYMKPKYSVITNIEADHLDVHENLENIKKSFLQFISHTENEVLACIDCENTREVINNSTKRDIIKTYSLKNSKADIYAKEIKIKNKETSFSVVIDNEKIGEFILNVPGEHNISNALPVIYFSLKFGVDKTLIKEALYKFKGSKRRYDILFDGEIRNYKLRIIDDYAHHPTEIKATLSGVKSVDDFDIVAVFQPHRYSRVKFLLDNFKGAFKDVKKVILLPIYSAGEENSNDVSIEKLKDSIGHSNIEVINEWQDIKEYVKKIQRNTTFVFMGAGNISKLAHELSEEINKN